MDDMIRFCRNIDEDDNDNGNNDDERSDIFVLGIVFVNVVEFITVVGVMDRLMRAVTLNAMVLLFVLSILF